MANYIGSPTKSTDGSKWVSQLTIDSAGTLDNTFATAGTYVDADIEITGTVAAASLTQTATGTINATANTTDTTYITTTKTAYPVVITADASIGTSPVVGVNQSGWIDKAATKTASVNAATQATKTIYIKAGTLSSDGGSVAVTPYGGLKIGSKLSSAPSSGYYIQADGAGSIGVSSAGWIDSSTVAPSTDSTAYYSIATASLANKATSGISYTTQTSPILISGSGLYINEGYIPNTYISLATLVPDAATLVATTSEWIYHDKTAYDNNGALITGSMPDVTVSHTDGTTSKTDITVTTAAYCSASQNTIDTDGILSSAPTDTQYLTFYGDMSGQTGGGFTTVTNLSTSQNGYVAKFSTTHSITGSVTASSTQGAKCYIKVFNGAMVTA